jgi:CopG family nickel-responsive transcriptional regulator
VTIVSISLNEDILNEIDKLQKSLGFSGRSEVIRAGIRTFVSEEKQKADLSGKQNAILLVIHDDEYDDVVAGIKHNYENLISTHLHSKIDGERCMELFILAGGSKHVKAITQGFQTNKNMDTVKLFAV